MSFGQAEADALVEAVRQVSAREIVPRFRALEVSDVDTKANADDLVTIADKRSEAGITAAVRDILPSARVVGEEAVSADRSVLDGVDQPGTSVVIDPIDGTWNYANGIATYGVILSVIEDGEIVFGLLYDPTCDDWVSARAGEGAWFTRPGQAPQQLHASRFDGPFDDSFGYVGLYLYHGENRRLLAETLPGFRRTISLRCSCHEYRMQTMGRGDFSLSAELNVWDHAGGVLTLREAGGVARLLDGREYRADMRSGRLLTAGSEPLWERLADLWSGLSA